MRRGKRFDIECRSRMRGDTNEGERDLSVGCSIICPIHTYYPVLSYIPYQIIHTCTLSRLLAIVVSIYPALRADPSKSHSDNSLYPPGPLSQGNSHGQERRSETRDEHTSLRMSRTPDDPSIPISKPSDSRTNHSIPTIPILPLSCPQANEPDAQLGSGNTVSKRRLGNDVGYVCGGRVRQRGGMGVLLIPLRGIW